MPPSFQMFATFATAPSGDVNRVATMTAPVMISATIATTLMIANQNSISPNAATDGRFNASSTSGVISAGIHNGVPGESTWT